MTKQGLNELMENQKHIEAIKEPMKALIDWAKEDLGNRGLYVVAIDGTHICSGYNGRTVNIVKGLALDALDDETAQMLLRKAIACVDEVQKATDRSNNKDNDKARVE